MNQFMALLYKFTIFDVVDILIVSYVFYRGILLIRGTRAVQLLKGIIVLLMATGLSGLFHLQALNWLLNRVLEMGLFAIPVVFQPELRRALEQLGRSNLLSLSRRWQHVPESPAHVITEIVNASQVFAKNRIGALVVLERETGLNEYIETGIAIGGVLSSELLINSFIPNTPLHDGAIIVRGDQVIAASCYLPLSDQSDLAKELGTRHRAAVGITEQSDALVVVVSEETGQISVAEAGLLTRGLDEQTLADKLAIGLNSQRRSAGLRFFSRRVGSP